MKKISDYTSNLSYQLYHNSAHSTVAAETFSVNIFVLPVHTINRDYFAEIAGGLLFENALNHRV